MKKIKIFLLTLVAALSLTGCIFEEDIPGSDESVTIMFRTASILDASASTRAIGVNSQNAVEDLYMLAYDATTKNFLYWKKAQSITDSDSDGSVKYATFEYDAEEQHNNLALRFYANVDGCTGIEAFLAGLTSSSVMDDEGPALPFTLSSAWNATSDSDFAPIPMWGGLVDNSGNRDDSGVTLVDGNNGGVTVNLMRAMARVNVVVNGLDGYEDVKISSVKVFNPRMSGYVTPLSDNMADDNTYKVKLPTVNGDPSSTPLVYNFSPAQIACNNTIFVPEASKEDQVYLIVALTDGASTRYIKLLFSDKSFESVDIMRSYSYTFHIFTSPYSGLMGYLTEEEAIANDPYNSEIEIDVVNDVYHNVMLTDGVTVLYVYDDQVKIPLAGGTYEYMVYTNYAGGWTVSNYSAPDLQFYKKNDPTTSYLGDDFKGDGNLNYYCTIELGPNSVNRVVSMIIAAGTLSKEVIIIQED